LLAWEYVSVMLAGDKASTGEMWECPAFFPLGDKYVLLISILGRIGTVYFVGSFDGARFVPETQAVLDYGLYFFAPQTLLDTAGRRLMIGWIWEGRSDAAQHTAGWSGLQSIPRHLTLRSDGRLGTAPIPELQVLRGRHSHQSGIVLNSAADHDLHNVRGTCLELFAEFEPGAAEAFGLKLLCSPAGEEQTLIAYAPQSGQLVIDGSHSSIDAGAQRDIQRAELRLAPHETLKLHIFLDQSVIEVFADEHVCLTSRVYPSRHDSVQVKLFAHGGRATLLSLDAWEMDSIWA
jgi:beta-fructofuranosidase